MRVFDLRCEHDHRFEGWFASSDAFEDQLARDLVSCPLCASTAVTRLPSAPHLNLSAARAVAPATAADLHSPRGRNNAAELDGRSQSVERSERADRAQDAGSAGQAFRGAGTSRTLTPEAQAAERLQARWLNMVREVVRNTENVGDAFAEEARKIHYREAPERAIRGVASADQVAELADEGIDVVAMAMPDVAKGSLQ